MDVCSCQGYMLTYPIRFLDLSIEPSIFYCFCHLVRSPEWFFVSSLMRCVGPQGFDWSKSSIWHWDNVPSTGVRFHHRHVPPFAVLALETALPAIMGTLGEYPPHPPQHELHPTRDGDKHLVVVPRRICVPVPHPEAQFRMVEQVQLSNECGVGWRDYDFNAFYIFHVAVS